MKQLREDHEKQLAAKDEQLAAKDEIFASEAKAAAREAESQASIIKTQQGMLSALSKQLGAEKAEKSNLKRKLEDFEEELREVRRVRGPPMAIRSARVLPHEELDAEAEEEVEVIASTRRVRKMEKQQARDVQDV